MNHEEKLAIVNFLLEYKAITAKQGRSLIEHSDKWDINNQHSMPTDAEIQLMIEISNGILPEQDIEMETVEVCL